MSRFMVSLAGGPWTLVGSGAVVTPPVGLPPSPWVYETFTIADPVTAGFGARPADIPDPIVGRPTGTGYIRYEDLYQTGDTVTQAMERMGDSGVITFPEGEFTGDGFPLPGLATFLVPKRCDGIIGSGPGTLGGSTGTVFKINPNTSTYQAPVQGTSLPSLARVMMRIGGLRGATFANFQVAGTEQTMDDGRLTPFHGLCEYDPRGRSVLQDLLITGWCGDNGAPPGEAMGIQVHSKDGSPDYHGHKFVRIETDGRREPGGRPWGVVGITSQNSLGGYMVDCNLHSTRGGGIVGYQVFDFTTYDTVVDQWPHGEEHSQLLLNGNCVNHERTDGITHYRIKLFRRPTSQGIHLTHSNDNWTANYDGLGVRTVTNGQCTLVDPEWTPIWNQSYLFLQSWSPYTIGGMEVGGDSMIDPPSVVEADGVTHIPYKWFHGPVVTLIP